MVTFVVLFSKFKSKVEMSMLQFSLNFCAVLTCSAYTSGGLNIGGLHIKISERSSNDRLLYENTFQSGAATLAATGTSMHWFTQDIVETYHTL